ncbi:MAG: single-stranded DNA-binding protein [Agathobacter sp.]
MNKVILMGRLTRDAEIRYSQGENATAIARFTLAVDRRFSRSNRAAGEEQTADFINCVAFSKTAEFMERFGRKGTKFVLEGRIQTGSYTNKDGQRVYTTDVVVENIEFAESKSSGNSAAQGQGGNTQPQPSPAPTGDDGFMNIPDGIDEELPFN